VTAARLRGTAYRVSEPRHARAPDPAYKMDMTGSSIAPAGGAPRRAARSPWQRVAVGPYNGDAMTDRSGSNARRAVILSGEESR